MSIRQDGCPLLGYAKGSFHACWSSWSVGFSVFVGEIGASTRWECARASGLSRTTSNGIWMPQWIQILDYADSYAYFVDYDAEGSIILLLFKILYLELVHKSFPFMRFGRAWFPGIGYSRNWKSEVNQKPRSCKQQPLSHTEECVSEGVFVYLSLSVEPLSERRYEYFDFCCPILKDSEPLERKRKWWTSNRKGRGMAHQADVNRAQIDMLTTERVSYSRCSSWNEFTSAYFHLTKSLFNMM